MLYKDTRAGIAFVGRTLPSPKNRGERRHLVSDSGGNRTREQRNKTESAEPPSLARSYHVR